MDQESRLSDQNKSDDNKGGCDKNSTDDSVFECNICLDTARDAVVSLCGHLFCWPCLYQWLYGTDGTHQTHKTCPVCKSAISRDKTIPIYGRGGDQTNRQDPRDKLPARPPGQRTEVPNSAHHQFPYGTFPHVFGFGDGSLNMSIGFGYPFQHLITSVIQVTRQDATNSREATMSQLLAAVGFLLIALVFWLN